MKWDEYFLKICETVSLKSHCHSRKIGAVLVKDNVIISTGYNGPPRGIPECCERFLIDKKLILECVKRKISPDKIKRSYENKICPRRVLEFPSGEGLEWCDSIHAEKNCLLSAARLGICTKDSILYFNGTISPCSQCLGACINAGIKEIVLIKNNLYDNTVEWLNKNSNIIIREFEI